MPVSNISNLRRLIGVQRCGSMNRPVVLGIDRPFPSTGCPTTLRIRPRTASPTGRGNGCARILYREAADEPFGRVHGNGPHRMLAQVLCDLEHQVIRLVADGGVRDGQRIEDRRNLAGREFDVHDGADYLSDLTCSHVLRFSRLLSRAKLQPFSASAPPTISISSVVTLACRARFIASVSLSIMSDAFLDALSIAVIRAPCSLAVASSIA